VRELEQAQALCVGAGERAALVAEQLALQQVLGYGAAVDGNEPRLAARAALVDGACHQFLARTRLAGDQDIDVRAGHLLDGVEHDVHGLALSDHLAERVAALDLPAQQPVLVAQLPARPAAAPR
jgi:hypothetical protein